MSLYHFPTVIQTAKSSNQDINLLVDMNIIDSFTYKHWSYNIKGDTSKFQNLPQLGFKIIKDNTSPVSQEQIKIQHPLGFCFNISSHNLASIIANNPIKSNGEINAHLLFCYQKKKPGQIFLVNQDFFEKETKIQNNLPKNTITIIPGESYLTVDGPATYLGYIPLYTTRFTKNRVGRFSDAQTLVVNKRKHHVFILFKYGMYLTRTYTLPNIVSQLYSPAINKSLPELLEIFYSNIDAYPMKPFTDILTPAPSEFSKIKDGFRKNLIQNLLWSFDFTQEETPRSFFYSIFKFSENNLLSIGYTPSFSAFDVKNFQDNELKEKISQMVQQFLTIYTTNLTVKDNALVFNETKNSIKEEIFKTISFKHFSIDFSQLLYKTLSQYNNDSSSYLIKPLEPILTPIFNTLIDNIFNTLDKHNCTPVDFSNTAEPPQFYNFNLFS